MTTATTLFKCQELYSVHVAVPKTANHGYYSYTTKNREEAKTIKPSLLKPKY